MSKNYQICSRCIMDTSDPDIEFDQFGICNHCREYDEVIKSDVPEAGDAQVLLEQLILKIKHDGKNKPYDCIVGVSGGVDSSYTVYKLKDLGLRPLAVHLDNGWNSELAVKNIEVLLKKLDIDLYTYVIDWEEFKDLQLAFLKASTPDSEIPTDHAILAVLYKIAIDEGVRYIISGHNLVTEGYGVSAWSQGHGDWRYIKSIHKQFGKLKRLNSFPRYGIVKFIYYKIFKRLRTVRILNYLPFKKLETIQLLKEKFDWQPYTGKHGESIYTAFYQGIILPQKFGFDKRLIHLSALISAGEITRDQALKEMENEPYPLDKLELDKEYVTKKLGLSDVEFEQIMNQTTKTFWDYPSYKKHPLFGNKLLVSIYHKLLAN